MSSVPTLAKPWRMHAAILLLTLMVGLGMTYVLVTGNYMNAVHQPLGETAIRIRVAVTSAHLWLEELAAGNPSVTAETVRAPLDQAARLARAMLAGGESGSRPVAPLAEPELRAEIAAVLTQLAEFRTLAEQRIALGGTSDTTRALDRQAHVAFDALLAETEHVETVLRRHVDRGFAAFQRTQAALILACVICGASVLLAFRRYDRRLLHHVQAVISATEKAQESRAQLAEAHQLLATLFDHTGVLAAYLDRDCNFLMVNRAYAQASGRAPEEFPGKNYFDLDPHPDQEALFRRVVETGEPHVTLAQPCEYAGHPEGGVSYRDWRLVPLRSPGGPVSGLVLTLLDVTERIQAMAALERSEGRYRSLFDTAPISLWEEDLSAVKHYLDRLRDAGINLRTHLAAHPEEVRRCAALVQVVAVNRATVDLYRAAGREALLAGITATFTDDDYRVFREGLTRLAAGQREIELDATTHTLTGETLHTVVRFFVAEQHAARWERVIVAVVDVTDRVRAQEEQRRLQHQMEHTQRLESLGVLAGGIAHDFNNLLTAIMGNVTLARARLAESDLAMDELQSIEEAGQRAADLCQQMLAYSGKGQFVVQPIDLSGQVEKMTKLLEVSIAKNVTLRCDLGTGLPAIAADAGQVQQVVMNLVLNGAEAIGDRPGVVSVATGSLHADRANLEKSVTGDPLRAGDYVYLEVSDTGCGMDHDARERVFEPFFTTKFTGRGLGMSAVLGIVRGHNGAIQLATAPRQGTTFRVLFPALAASARTAQPQPRGNGRWRGSGTVLVVEDEAEVRHVATQLLHALGFTTITAEDGAAAVALAQGCGADFAVVLLDMTMPGMSGIATCRALREIRPDLKVVLTSGYSAEEATEQFMGTGLAGFLQKPYTLATLRAKMEAVLGPPAGSP